MATNIPPAVLRRVRRGISVLDMNGPADWRESINVRHLNINSNFTCVLGQLYGYYTVGLDRLPREVHRNPDRYGFSIPITTLFTMDGSKSNQDWAQLTEAWKRELAA